MTEKVNKYINSKAYGEKGIYLIESQILDGDVGANGILLKAKQEGSNQYFAIKISKATKGTKYERFLEERKFHLESRNRYIVKAIDKGVLKIGSEKPKEFYVMPIYDCNYIHIISSGEKEYISDQHIKLKFCLDICRAIKYIHSKNIIYRDLKPENILYDKRHKKVLLADFGIAKYPTSNKTESFEKMGNADYHSPEQSKYGSKKYGKYTDIYALGLIINQTFTGEIPCGSNYKTIGSVYPPFSFLDEIVETMINQTATARENDINVIINKIEIEKKKVTEFKENIICKINYDLESVDRSLKYKCRDQIVNDLFLAQNLLEHRMFCSSRINVNYHCNISYNTKKRVLNYCLAHMIFDIVTNKFYYEARIDYKNEYPISLDDGLLEKFDCLTNDLCLNKECEEYIKRSKKLFFNLKSYHAKEILEAIPKKISIVKDSLLDAPLLWICCYLSRHELIKELENCNGTISICDIVDLNPNRICNVLANDNLFNQSVSTMESFINCLKNKYPSICKINTQQFSILGKEYNKLNDYYNRNFKDSGSASDGDIIQFFRSFERQGRFFTFELYEYQIAPLSEFLKLKYNT